MLREDTLRAREAFLAAFASIGGWAMAVPARAAFEIAYEKLNPDRAARHPAPGYTGPRLQMSSPKPSAASTNAKANGASSIETTLELGDEAIDESIDLAFTRLTTPANGNGKTGVPLEWVSTEEHFANSPRETLCFTPIRLRSDHFLIGGLPVMTLSLHRLPTKTFAGLMEALTRQAGVTFPYELSSTFLVGDQQQWDEKFERMLRRARINIIRTHNPNQDEEIRRDQIYELRNTVKRGEEKVGEIGLTITFNAPTENELFRRRDILLAILRQMDSMEAVAEPSMPLGQFIATLPCAGHTDFRRRPVLSHNAVGLLPLTGAAAGVPEGEAIDVLQRADGGLFFWNPRSRMFPSGMGMFCGPTGSGKSAAVNRQRTVLLANGHRGVTLDFGGSATRICTAVGGEYIDVTDAKRSRGLGLFDIRPKPDERYDQDELTEDGLPLDRLAQVQTLLEMLALDPTKPYEIALDPVYKTVLDAAVQRTYENLVDEAPTIGEFIRTLERAPKKDREKGENLAARLKVFSADGSLARFLNDRSEPISVDNPYTVFDFRGTNPDENARLMLVASMAVTSFLSRLLRVGRHVPKFLDVDEFNVIRKHRLLCRAVDQAIRTARKQNAICSVVSQDPADFDSNDDAKGIRGNCEVFWLFGLHRPEYVAEVLELSPGMVKLLRRNQATASRDYRDCVLKYPGGAVHLRLRNGPMDRRLLLGAGVESATQDEALAAVSRGTPLTQNLIDALSQDGLGANLKDIILPAGR